MLPTITLLLLEQASELSTTLRITECLQGISNLFEGLAASPDYRRALWQLWRAMAQIVNPLSLLALRKLSKN